MKIAAISNSFSRSLVLLTFLLALLLAPISADDNDVVRRGRCTGGGTYELELSRENGKLEIEFEIEGKANQQWNVVIKRRGNVIFRGKRTTGSISKEFTVRLLNGPGTGGEIEAVATRAGQRCAAKATYA